MAEGRTKLDSAIGFINTLLAAVAAAMIVFMMLAICYSVMTRFLWNRPVPWIVEVSSYLMLYITFLGMAWLQGKDGHVRIDLFLTNAKPRTLARLDVLTSLGGAAVGLVLAWKGAGVTVDYYLRGVTVIGILNTPQWLLMGIIPIGGTLLFLEFILRTWRSLQASFQRDSRRDAGSEAPTNA